MRQLLAWITCVGARAELACAITCSCGQAYVPMSLAGLKRATA